MRNAAFLVAFLLCATLSAQLNESNVTGGAYVSLADPKNTVYSPTYAFLNGSTEWLSDSFFLNFRGGLLYGFPEIGDPATSRYIITDNRLYNSYDTGNLVAIAEYHNDYFSIGSATGGEAMPDATSMNRRIRSEFNSYRTLRFSEELFGTVTPVDGLALKMVVGYNQQDFHDKGQGDQTDHNIYTAGDLSYLPIPYAGPFFAFRYTDDLESSEQFNWTNLRAGARGRWDVGTDFSFFYEAYYKYLASPSFTVRNDDGSPVTDEFGKPMVERQIVDNHHFGLYAKARYHFDLPGDYDIDLFGWVTQEYAVARSGDLKYVDRSFTLMYRQWFFDHRLHASLGTTVMFERGEQTLDETTGALLGGYSTKGIYVPVWPFVEVAWHDTELSVYVRYHHKFGMTYKNQQSLYKTYLPTQQKVLAGVQYRIFRALTPYVEFYFNDVVNFVNEDVDSLGLTIGISSTF